MTPLLFLTVGASEELGSVYVRCGIAEKLKILKVTFGQAVVAPILNPSTQKAEAGYEFEASLVYRASSRTDSKATQRNPVLKSQNK